ncbi:PTK1-like protein [Pseudohyphozyma bogoriensis]|nr:PTK1-like protein [Pseudohyphozyma bogoriensis]
MSRDQVLCRFQALFLEVRSRLSGDLLSALDQLSCLTRSLPTGMRLMDHIANLEAEHTELSIASLLLILKQISNGLRWIHHQRVSHRDIKPNNILVENLHGTLRPDRRFDVRGLTCKIADFGVSVIRSRDPETPKPQVECLGVLGYRAPELMLVELNYGNPPMKGGLPLQPNTVEYVWAEGPAQDVFALGCIAGARYRYNGSWSFMNLSDQYSLISQYLDSMSLEPGHSDRGAAVISTFIDTLPGMEVNTAFLPPRVKENYSDVVWTVISKLLTRRPYDRWTSEATYQFLSKLR